MPFQELLPRRDLHTMFPGKVCQDDQLAGYSHSRSLRSRSGINTLIEILTGPRPAYGVIGSLHEIRSDQGRSFLGESTHDTASGGMYSGSQTQVGQEVSGPRKSRYISHLSQECGGGQETVLFTYIS